MPVSVRSGGTWFGKASKQLGNLFQAVGLDDEGKKELSQALSLVTGEWGQTPVRPSSKASPWISSAGNDGSPVEFSVAINPTTGEAEPTPSLLGNTNNTTTTWQALTSAAMNLTDTIAATYSPSVSLSRFHPIRDLFLPSTPKWQPPQKHTTLCDNYHPHGDIEAYEIQRFVAAMAGPVDFDRRDADIVNKKPLLSCFAFTGAPSANGTETGSLPAVLVSTTVHFPIDAYVPDDGEARRRIEAYYDSGSVIPGGRGGGGVEEGGEAKERYRKVLSAVHRRPLDYGRGIHGWVSLKQRLGGKGVENTFYLCGEMFC